MAAAAAAAHRALWWWLVDRPAVSSFEWVPHRTVGASPAFAATAIAAYVSLVLLLHRRLLPLPSPSPRLLRLASTAHNLLLVLLSVAMAAGCSLAALASAPSPRWLFCFPPAGATPPAGPVFYWAHVFYLSKLFELADTLFILLGRRPLSFLHVYHHTTVIAMSYLWLATAQSLLPIALVTNAAVHVVMYGYYLSCSLGLRWPPRWKRAVTELQIAQFLFSFAASGVFLWFHFAGGGCEGMNGWVFNAVFNASLLALFLNFHTTAYVGTRKAGKGKKEAHHGR